MFPSLAAALSASVLLGALRHALADRYVSSDHIVLHTVSEPSLATVSARVVTDPRIIEPDPTRLPPHASGPRTRIVVEAEQLRGISGPIRVSGLVGLSIRDAVLHIRPGDGIRVTGWLYQSLPPANPGAFDWRLKMRRDGLRVGLSCAHAESVVVTDRADAPTWSGLLARLRARLRSYLVVDAFEPDDPAAGIVTAMVLAQRSDVARELNDAFIRSGNAHFLAASGMNVAWLAWAGWSVLRLLGVYYRPAAVVIALMIASYVLIAEPEPSILRAGIGGLIWCAAIFLRRRPHAVNWLACSAIVILLIDPMDLFRPAFQFSFLGVLALLFFCPHVAAMICWLLIKVRLPREAIAFDRTRWAPLLAANLFSDKPEKLHGRIGVWLVELLAVALSAWLVTAPLSCYLFGRFTPWGGLGTFLATFLALPLTCVGYVTALLSLVFPSLASLFAPLLGWITARFVGLVQWLADLPYATIACHPSTVLLVLTYAVFAAWLARRERARMHLAHALISRGRRAAFLDALDAPSGDALPPADPPHARESAPMPAARANEGPPPFRARAAAFIRARAFPLAALVLAAAWLTPASALRSFRGQLNVWLLAVGDGTATVVELPDGQVWIYDVGTRSSLDAGNVVRAFLEARRIRRVDAVLISHADSDHYSGLESLLGEVSIGRVVINDHFEFFAPPESNARRCLDAVAAAGVPVEVIAGPHELTAGDAAIECVWPPARSAGIILDANDTSTVVRIVYQGRAVLLSGDIDAAAQSALIRRGCIGADVLALPHHGAVVETTADFIRAAGPTCVVRSTGQRRALTTSGIEMLVPTARYYSTADDGCIRVRVRSGECDVRSMREGL